MKEDVFFSSNGFTICSTLSSPIHLFIIFFKAWCWTESNDQVRGHWLPGTVWLPSHSSQEEPAGSEGRSSLRERTAPPMPVQERDDVFLTSSIWVLCGKGFPQLQAKSAITQGQCQQQQQQHQHQHQHQPELRQTEQHQHHHQHQIHQCSDQVHLKSHI